MTPVYIYSAECWNGEGLNNSTYSFEDSSDERIACLHKEHLSINRERRKGMEKGMGGKAMGVGMEERR